MNESRTYEEMQAHYIEKMGRELGELFKATSDELSWIHWRWSQYRILFGEKPSRIDLSNEGAPFFFQIIHNVLFEDTMLGIARIVGPSKSMGKANLTIQRFPDYLTDPELKAQIEALVEVAKKSCEFTIDWRHRRLAHRDLALALNDPKVTPLTPATRAQVEEALSALREILGCIEGKYSNAHTAYSAPVPGDARQLLYYIKMGMLRERDKRACWKRGELHDDDINPPGEV